MNRYEFICQYCGFTWRLAYTPTKLVCDKCKDANIRVINLDLDKVDYYVGCPALPDDYRKKNWNS